LRQAAATTFPRTRAAALLQAEARILPLVKSTILLQVAATTFPEVKATTFPPTEAPPCFWNMEIIIKIFMGHAENIELIAVLRQLP
jgi:hypothetical protein